MNCVPSHETQLSQRTSLALCSEPGSIAARCAAELETSVSSLREGGSQEGPQIKSAKQIYIYIYIYIYEYVFAYVYVFVYVYVYVYVYVHHTILDLVPLTIIRLLFLGTYFHNGSVCGTSGVVKVPRGWCLG